MLKKLLSSVISLCLIFSAILPCFAAERTSKDRYKITNPYEAVTELLPEPDNHYKTNLHTHSTVSDGRISMPDMIKTYYEENFDVLAMAEHGVIGKEWNKEPTRYILMRICEMFNSISDKTDYFSNQYAHLSDEEYEAITGGTYGFSEDGTFTPEMNYPFSEETHRKFGRGLNCMTTGIELSAASVMESHVNSYFSDFGECYAGMLTHEGDYEFFVKNVEKAGGVSVINHPGHYLNSKFIPENATNEDQLFYFADILNRYPSCLGIETFNNNDRESANNRYFWDALLQYVIPYGQRNVFGFSNSDAHKQKEVDTEFMDFILPSFSQDNMRKAMESGAFFATGRIASLEHELGGNFSARGPVPQVTGIHVDDETDTITVTARNAKRIEWIANGTVIENSVSENEKGELVSVLKLSGHSDEVTCYVRFQIFGDGGFCYSNPFICDDGNMERFIIEDTRTGIHVFLDYTERFLERNIIGALFKILAWSIEKKLY